ncbi:MAG: hypothetical protein HYY34_00535 [Chloroflexi bacterium]|nr:hypothetical protein [Chloroflexota bacterium]
MTNVHRDIAAGITVDDVWRCLGPGERSRAALAREVETATAEAVRLATPAAVSTSLGLVGARRGSARFDNDTVLEGRMLPHLLEGAEGAVFLIATAGQGIEARVAELFAAADTLEAFVLDAAGSATAMAVFSDVAARIAGELAAAGQRIGPCLKPGTDAWTIEGQRPIFGVLPAAEIGVRLLDSLLMYPQKTQSGIIPYGRDLRIVDDPDSSPCARCSAARCPMRREDYAGPLVESGSTLKRA